MLTPLRIHCAHNSLSVTCCRSNCWYELTGAPLSCDRQFTVLTKCVSSAGAEWLETPGNCLAASISQQNSWVVLTPSSIVEIPVEGNIDESEGLHPSMPAFVRDHEPSSGAGGNLCQVSFLAKASVFVLADFHVSVLHMEAARGGQEHQRAAMLRSQLHQI